MTDRPKLPGRRDAGRRLAGLALALAGGRCLAAAAPPAVLTVAAYPAVDDIVREARPRWNALYPGVDIKVVSRQTSDHHTAMTTALSTSFYLPDVMALEVGYVGRFAQGGGLEDLGNPAYGMRHEAQQYVPYAVAQATNRRGQIVAAPSDIGPGTLLYRHDLLTRAGIDEAALTRSWDSFIAAGARLKAASGAFLLANARDLKDIVIRTGLRPGDGLYFDGDSNVLVESPRFVRAFELARAARQQKLDARVTAWSNEWSEGFRRGTIATQMSGAWLAGHLANWLAPATQGLWRAAQLPEGSFAAYGGTFLAIPRGVPAERKALAWALIRLLTLDRERQLAAFKAHDAFPALLAAQQDDFFTQPLPFLGGQPARALWRDAALRISAIAVHKQDAFADEVINTELDKVLDQGKAIAPALSDAARLLARRAHR